MNYIRSSIIYLIIFALITSITEVNPSQNIDKIPTVQAASQEIPEWNIQCLNAENSYEESRNLKKIKVALLDSGLDYDPDIPFAEREDFLGADDLSAIFQDYTGHGTSAASLICAAKNDDSITGIAANVELYSARILDENNQAPVSRVIDAIKWAMEKKVNIIHMSFGTKRYSKELHDIVQKAYDQGILIIAPAGNDGTAQEDESTVEYPAAFPCVIAVGATNTSNVKTELSSSGEEMDLVAPGEQILSTGSFGGVIVAEGTSMAAAQVTGIAAVLWGKYPDKSNQFIRELLLNSANKTVASEDCQNGLADYAQSEQNYKKMNSVYRTFKKMGRSEEDAVSNAGKWISGDTKKVETHTEVNYVNGAWRKKDHEFMTDNSIKNFASEIKYKELSSNLSIIKRGSIQPDYTFKTAGASYHPSFHGMDNFIANTEYILHVACTYLQSKNAYDIITLPEYNIVFGAKNPITKKKNNNKDIKTDLKNAISELFQDILKSTPKSKEKNTWTNKQKGYALLGVALHNATDAFSHRAYIKYNNEYSKVVHKSTALINENAKKNGVAAIWNDYYKTVTDKKEREYFRGLINSCIIADDASEMQPLYQIAQKFVTQIMYNIVSDTSSASAFRTAFQNYKNSNDKIFKLEEVDTYWNNTFMKEEHFDINYKKRKLTKPKVTVSIKKNKISISISVKPGYHYIVVWEEKDKKQNRQFVPLTNKKKGKITFSIATNKIKYDYLAVYSYLDGNQKHTRVSEKKYAENICFLFSADDTKHISKKERKKKKYTKKYRLIPGRKIKTDLKLKCKSGYKLKTWFEILERGRYVNRSLPIRFKRPGKTTLYPEIVKKKKVVKKKNRKRGK